MLRVLAPALPGPPVRGTWFRTRRWAYGSVAVACCPQCGGSIEILGDRIMADGTVTPDVVCDNGRCLFAGPCRLDRWTP